MISNLPYKYPIPEHTHFFETLPYKNVYIENSWILVPTKILELIKNFILFKRIYGSKIEIEFYASMDANKMLKRIYRNRPLGFMGGNDFYLLQNCTEGIGHWETIGTSNEQEPLVLNRFMSYDEIEISAFLNVSIFTPFINKGSRKNYGKREEDCQPNGICIGQIGPRFQKQNRMEWRYMIIDPEQNTVENGYGPNNTTTGGMYLSLWANFYGIDYFPLFTEVETNDSGRFYKMNNGTYLDILVYKRRIGYSAEVFLKEANHRAGKIGKQAFCHVVGLGLGVWLIAAIQNVLTIEVYLEILSAGNFPNISDLYFAWFNITDQEFKLPNSIGNIHIHKGFRDPSERLNDPGKLLVANWAWDANSYIGNEYWCGNLGSSGDPAASCSSFIAYIANPDLHDISEVHHF